MGLCFSWISGWQQITCLFLSSWSLTTISTVGGPEICFLTLLGEVLFVWARLYLFCLLLKHPLNVWMLLGPYIALAIIAFPQRRILCFPFFVFPFVNSLFNGFSPSRWGGRCLWSRVSEIYWRLLKYLVRIVLDQVIWLLGMRDL
jgi:hypothetical protein